MMRRAIRITLTVIVLSALVIVGIQVLGQQNTTPEANPANQIQDEVIVRQGDLTVTVSATGAIAPTRQVSLLFEFSAPVQEVLVTEGESVKAGTVLARLDSSDLESSLADARLALENQRAAFNALTAPAREVDLAVAQAALNAAYAQSGASSSGADAAQVQIAQLQAELARNQLWQTQLQRDLQPAQIQQLLDQIAAQGVDVSQFGFTVPNPADNVSPQVKQAEYGVALADVQAQGVSNTPADVAALSAANAAIIAAQAQLDRLANGPTELQRQIADIQIQIATLSVEQAEATAARTVLRAPYDGVVARHNLVVGEVPPTNSPAVLLVDTSGFYVDVAVDETDIVNLQVGQLVELKLDALPGANISGRVTRVAVTPVRVEQLVTYIARVTLDATDEPVRAGMTATATIIVSELNDVLTLPNRFIRIDRATRQAFVTVAQADGTFADVPVELGVRNETASQIVSGVDSGARVVLLPRASFNPIG